MKTQILRCLIAMPAVVTALACGPVQATSATWAQPGVPQWLDHTVYRPNSPAHEYDCDGRFDRRARSDGDRYRSIGIG